jgi:cellulose synthase/poly-beta-1,6-N-acetylglucosamine synthase-like glycosyltransferase
MIMVAVIAFSAGWLLVFYVYVGYPAVVTLLGRPGRRHLSLTSLPRVTVVFCAHNEESVLAEKIENCRSLDYPRDLLEFCVGSDGSTDSTNAVLEAWVRDDARVRLTRSPQRVGKTSLLNQIVPSASGDVILFSDASTLFVPEAVRRHVVHYADPHIGCVGGGLDFTNTDSSPVSGGHGAFWRYERHLRKCESNIGILACVAGANYSMRRALWRSVQPHFADDCNSPLNVIEQGFRVVYDESAMAREVAAESSRGLMSRRVRMVTRDLDAILSRPALLNPARFLGVSWSLWSHKLLRWLSAPLLVALLVGNVFLMDRALFRETLALQVGFYIMALVGYLLRSRSKSRVLSLPLYFSLSNAAALLGLANVLGRRPATTWQPGGRR